MLEEEVERLVEELSIPLNGFLRAEELFYDFNDEIPFNSIERIQLPRHSPLRFLPLFPFNSIERIRFWPC